MEKRRVTVLIGGKPYSFYSDDPDEYISALEKRTNDALRQAGRLSGLWDASGAVLAVILQTDRLMRTEQEGPKATEKQEEPPKRTEAKGARKSGPKAAEEDRGQISVWDLIGEKRQEK